MKQPEPAKMKIDGVVLASTSPRRREMLHLAGVDYIAIAPDVEEKRRPGELAADYVLRNGNLKALNVSQRFPDVCKDALILASDTVVVSPSGDVLEKPTDESHARDMILSLRGQTHQVLSSIVILYGSRGIPIVNEVISTSVRFGHFPLAWLESYLQSDEPYDKAGGYGIQGQASTFVAGIEGSYSNVVGLPLFETLIHLHALDQVRRFFQNQSQRIGFGQSPLLAISKGHNFVSIRLAAAFGQMDFGENYLQELQRKRKSLADLSEIRWHFTGTLQSNKIEPLVQSCDVVHSLTTLEKAVAIQKACLKHNRHLDVFLKVATSKDSQASSGLSWDEALKLLQDISAQSLNRIKVLGFMGMAPLGYDESQILTIFEDWMSKGRQVWQEFGNSPDAMQLSLGMSGDAHLARQAARNLGLQAPMIRLGTAIFGERPESRLKA